MTAKTWNGTDTSWNTAGNWSPTGVPGASDDVTFDATSVQSCTADVAIDVLSITISSGYSGTLDFADSAYSHSIGGDFTASGTGTLDLGDSVVTCSGNCDLSGQTTFVRGTSEIILDGTGKTITGNGLTTVFNNLTIDGSITQDDSDHLWLAGALKVNLTKTFVTSSIKYVYVYNNATLNNLGTITLNNILQLRQDSDVTSWGTLTGTGKILCTRSNATTTLASGTCGVDFEIISNKSGEIYVQNGDIIFNGNFTINATTGNTVTWDNSGNYNLTFKGDVSLIEVATLTWTKGTGSITASGTANQAWDFIGKTTEEIIVNKTSGTLTLSGNVDPDYCSVYGGVLDIDGNDMTMAGLMYVDGDQTVQDTTGGGLITCGSLNINGTSGHPCVWNGPDLDVTGATANADYCTVTNSNASAGTAITATDCTDNGGNTNWNFGAAPTQYQYGRPIYFTEEMMGALLQL